MTGDSSAMWCQLFRLARSGFASQNTYGAIPGGRQPRQQRKCPGHVIQAPCNPGTAHKHSCTRLAGLPALRHAPHHRGLGAAPGGRGLDRAPLLHRLLLLAERSRLRLAPARQLARYDVGRCHRCHVRRGLLAGVRWKGVHGLDPALGRRRVIVAPGSVSS